MTSVIVISISPDNGGITRDRYRSAESISCGGIGGSEFIHLAPVIGIHPVFRSKIYADPLALPLSSFPKAPTIAVSPEIATGLPKISPAAASEAMSFLHLAPVIQLRPYSLEDICRAAITSGIVIKISPDNGGIARDRYRDAEEIIAAASEAVSFLTSPQIIRHHPYCAQRYMPSRYYFRYRH